MLKTAKGKEARLQKKTDARGAPVNWELPPCTILVDSASQVRRVQKLTGMGWLTLVALDVLVCFMGLFCVALVLASGEDVRHGSLVALPWAPGPL